MSKPSDSKLHKREVLDPQSVGGYLRDHLDEVLSAPLPSRMQILLARLEPLSTAAHAPPDPQSHRPAIEEQPRDLGPASAPQAPRHYTIRRMIATASYVKKWGL
jgi:hypothetical protein